MQNVKELPLESIRTSELNPRKYFDEGKIKELADSIKEKGLIQPILVRPVDGKYELVVGERRFKAARLAKVKNIPAIVRILNDESVLEFQIIENLQRDDLNPIEEAGGFKALLEKCKYTQEILAEKIGKSQGHIAARLALLNLTDDFQQDIIAGNLLPGHVKHLMVISDRHKILKAIRKEMGQHKEQLTVRAFEGIVGTVLGRQAKQLGRTSWGGGPEFNPKDCSTCEFKRSIHSPYGPPEKKCVNADCYNKKQRLVRKAKSERVKKKIEKGGVVDESQLKDVEDLKRYGIKFDTKTCKRCEKKKIAFARDYGGKKVKKEVCTDKECFGRKNVEAEKAKEKQKARELEKQIEKIKAKAARSKMDRNFWALILTDNLVSSYNESQEPAAKAYGLDVNKLKNRKSALEYFTSNKKLNLEEIFRFITYWED